MSASPTRAVIAGARAGPAVDGAQAGLDDLLAGGAHAVEQVIDALALGEVGATLPNGHLPRSPELKRPVLPPEHRPLVISPEACGAAPQLHHDHSVGYARSPRYRPDGQTCG